MRAQLSSSFQVFSNPMVPKQTAVTCPMSLVFAAASQLILLMKKQANELPCGQVVFPWRGQS